MSRLYLLPLAGFIHSTKEKGSYGEAVFQEEKKDLEAKTSSFGCFLDYLVPDKNVCQRK